MNEASALFCSHPQERRSPSEQAGAWCNNCGAFYAIPPDESYLIDGRWWDPALNDTRQFRNIGEAIQAGRQQFASELARLADGIRERRP